MASVSEVGGHQLGVRAAPKSVMEPFDSFDKDNLRPFAGILNAIVICTAFYVLLGMIIWYLVI
jgi:hypothetical protein